MPTTRIPVTSGPSKVDLLRAANPDDHRHALFDTPDGMIEAHIEAIEEIGVDGGLGPPRLDGLARRCVYRSL